MTRRTILFDFDGVIADSEVLANQSLADHLTAHGLPTTLAQSYDRYMGKRFSDIEAIIAAELGRPLPPDFAEQERVRLAALFESSLQPVAGVHAFINAHPYHRKAVASSSAPPKLAFGLARFGLADHFGAHVYSATMVARGKPDPDIYLLACDRLQVRPGQCIVIEDSPSGVRAGRAAGITTIGLLAASHIRPQTRGQLQAAGADYIANDYTEVAAVLRQLDSK